MVYIEIEDNKIKGIYCATNFPVDSKNYREVPSCFPGVVGQSIAEFDAEWRLRPLADRLREKLIPDAERYKAVGCELVRKTQAELVRDGVEETPEGMKLDTSGTEPALVPMTRGELVASGQLSKADAHKLDLADEEQVLLAVLAKNDWYYTRKTRNGKAVPTEVDELCNSAAERISAIRMELA